MFLTILLMLGLIATPVATPIAIPMEPDQTVVLPADVVVRPLIVDDTIFLGTGSGDVLAVDATTGTIIWTTPLQGQASDAFAMNGEVVLVPGVDGTLYQLDIATGEFIGATVLGSERLQTPVITETVIAVPSSNGTIYILDPDTLEQVDAIVVGARITARREIIGDAFVVPVDDNGLVSLSLPDLSTAWNAVTFSAVKVLLATPGNQLIIGQEHGEVSALDSDGTVLWHAITDPSSVLDLASAGNLVMVAQSDGLVVSLDLQTGEPVWQSALTGEAHFASSVCEATCIVSVSSGALTLVNPINGDVEQVAVLPAEPTSQPIQQDSHLVVPVSGGTILIWRIGAE